MSIQFEPSGIVKILTGISWSNDYRDTRYFASLGEQTEYFNSKEVLYQSTENSYIRQEIMYIAVNENIENLWRADYIMFQNVNMGTKWFYAFVTDLVMKAAYTTFVYFEIDVMQTWMFDLKPIQAYIQRKHFGIENKNTLYFAEEDIGTGESYVTVKSIIVGQVNQEDSVVLITSTVDLSANPGTFDDPSLTGASGGLVHGLPTGCNYYVIGEEYGCTVFEFFQTLESFPWISKGIIGATVIPKYMLNGVTVNTVGLAGESLTVGVIYDTAAPIMETVFSENILSQFPDVSKQKLLMYPYAYVELSLFNGTTLIIKPQYTNNGYLSVQRKSVISANPEVKYWVTGYENGGLTYDFSLNIRDFPQCPVQDTSYLLTIDQTQRYAEMNGDFNVVNSILGAVGALFSLNAGGVVSSLNSGYQQSEKIKLDLKYADALSPTLATQSGGSGFNFATGEMGLHIRWRMCDPAHRKMIADYWNMFGYACKEVEIVNPTRMSRFDYVATRDCHVVGSAPNDHIKKIEQIYNTGIRFWHDDNIGDYSNNTGVSN